MAITIFSFFSAVLWCNVFIIIMSLLQNHQSFIYHFSIKPLLCFAVICILRLLCFFEFPYITIISSTRVLPSLILFIRTPLSLGTISFQVYILLIVFWLIGSLYFSVKFVKLFLFQRNFICYGKELFNPRIQRLMAEITTSYKDTVSIRIVQSSEITIPLIAGYFKPTIYLPSLPLTDEQLRNILSHEWTHFVHKDAWIKLFVSILQVLFWWNPLLYIFQKRLDHLLEIHCDLIVTKNMDKQAVNQYLETILYIFRQHIKQTTSSKISPLSASAFVNSKHKSQLEQRFRLVLNQRTTRKNRIGTAMIYAIIIISYLISNAFVVQSKFENPNDYGYEIAFSINPQNAYLQPNQDGTYGLYVDGKYCITLMSSDIYNAPYSSLTIK